MPAVPERVSLIVTAADDGRVMRVPLGAELSVRLAENASTGFRWAVDRPARRILRLIGGGVLTPPLDDGGSVGSAGTHTFVFRAAAPGRGRLRFKLWRPWEGDESIARRLTVTVLVEQTERTEGTASESS